MREKWKLVLAKECNMKLNAYGFSENAIAYIKSQLSNKFQRTDINKEFSTWKSIFRGAPQGSMLGPWVFNISINNIFYFIESCYLCNYSDGNTLYALKL